MTAERVVTTFEAWSTRIMVLCAIGTCLCFIGIGYLQTRVNTQAQQGQKARERQERVFPVSMKVYRDARERGVISREELECFRVTAKCEEPPRR